MRRLRLGEQDVLRATSRVIVPLFVGLAGGIALPPLACFGIAYLLHRFTGIDSYALLSGRFVCKLDIFVDPILI